MTNYRYIQLVFAFCVFGITNGQELEQSYLNTLGDEPLLTLFDKHTGDSVIQEKIARTYLDRARTQKDTIKMARGYDRLARIFHPEKNIAFADSVIALTKNKNHMTYPAMGYLIKGHELTDINLTLSTKNFYKAYDYSLRNNNTSQQIYLLNILTIRKAYWGNEKEALDAQRKNHKILYQENIDQLLLKGTRKGYLTNFNNFKTQMQFNSNITYVMCFIQNNKLDSAGFYLKQAQKLNSNYEGYAKESQKTLILECLNEINFYKGNYRESVIISDSLIERHTNNYELSATFDAYLIKGQSLLKLNREEDGIQQLLKADSIYNKTKIDLLPYRQKLFRLLLEYYKEEQNTQKQLEFHEKINKADSISKRNYAFYEVSLKNKIETPLLLAEKQSLIAKLQKENQEPDPKVYIVLAALVTSLCFLFYYVRKRLVYKKRFEALLAKNKKQKLLSLHDSNYKSELSVEVVEDILQKLERFERQHKFLRPDITLHSLAKECKTNSNYLSRVINLKLEKNFSQYIHDLRITYATEELLTNPAYRKYTIKAIAEESGYANSESFSRAFYKINGIYPSYYIKKLDKEVG